jgi:hypothetical protein
MVKALGGQEQRWCQRERARHEAGLCKGVCMGVVDQAMTRSNRGGGQGRKGGLKGDLIHPKPLTS